MQPSFTLVRSRHGGMAQRLALPLIFLLAPSVALAGPGPGELREAKVAIENGTDHFRASRYQEAVTDFRKALAVLREPGLIWNIARAYEELGDVRNAVHYFRELVAKFPKDRSAKEAKQRIERLKPRLPGTLSLDCGEEVSAPVVIDGGKVQRCDMRFDPLSPGMHSVRASSEEHGVWRKRVKVEPGQKLSIKIDWKEAEPAKPAVVEGAYSKFEGANIASEQGGKAAPPVVAPPPPRGPLPVLVLGAGALMLVGGGVVAMLSSTATDDFEALRGEEAVTASMIDDKAAKANSLANTALGLSVAGAVALAAGAYLMSVDPAPEASPKAVSWGVVPADDGGLVVLGGAF